MALVTTHEDHSAVGWYRELTTVEKRTFWACFGGWALDAMDVQMFSFVIPAIIAAFAITLPLGRSIGVFALIAYGIMIAAALALPETKGRELTVDQ